MATAASSGLSLVVFLRFKPHSPLIRAGLTTRPHGVGALGNISVFSLTQIAVSTLVGGALAYVAVVLYARRTGVQVAVADSLLIAATVGLSILIWREAGNTQSLNDDPIPLVSPNDVLAPVVTYVGLGLLAAFRSSIGVSQEWPRLRALLTLLSLVVNVVTI
jgi:hypothetical protein